jgi:hypothetical protein
LAAKADRAADAGGASVSVVAIVSDLGLLIRGGLSLAMQG